MKIHDLPYIYNICPFSDEEDKSILEKDPDLHGIGINDFLYAVGRVTITNSYYEEELLWNEILCGYGNETREETLDRVYKKYTDILTKYNRKIKNPLKTCTYDRKTIVINIFGGPGVGKSTISAELFFQMKLKNLNVEMASEWIKNKLFEGTKYPFNDQLYTLAKQNKLLKQLNGKADYIITDSPLLLSIIYQKNEPQIFNSIVLEYFNLYHNINFLINRNHKYQEFGRNQNEQEANIVHLKIKNLLNEYNIQYFECKSNTAIGYILTMLKIDGGACTHANN